MKNATGCFRTILKSSTTSKPASTGYVAPREKMLAQHVPNRRSDHSLPAAHTFQDRMRNECEPINDLDLHRHCIASFSARYP